MKICRHNFDGLGHCDIGGGADYCIEGPCDHEDPVEFAPVVHGRWVPFHSEAGGDIQHCSACEIGFAAKMDFCPNCGARTDGGGTNA